MKKRNIALLAGAAMVLAGIIAASVILMKVSHSDGERSQELTTTERKEDADDDEGNTTERRDPDEKEIMEVYGPGYLYYLDPDGEEASAGCNYRQSTGDLRRRVRQYYHGKPIFVLR